MGVSFNLSIGIDVLVEFGLEHELGMFGGHGFTLDSILLLLIFFIDDEEYFSEGAGSKLFSDLELLEDGFACVIESVTFEGLLFVFHLFLKYKVRSMYTNIVIIVIPSYLFIHSHCYKLTLI